MKPRRGRDDGDEEDPLGAADSAFVDVVSNALLMVLIMTLLLVLTAGLARTGAKQPVSARERLPFQAPERTLLPPWTEYLLVDAGRVLALDLDAVAQAVLAGRFTTDGEVWSGETAQVGFQLDAADAEPLRATLRLPLGDVDSYRLRLRPRSDWLTAAPDLAPGADAEAALVTRLAAACRDGQRAATVLVTPGGMARFAPLHRRLVLAGVRFRWTPLLPEEPIELARRAGQFNDFLWRW